MADASPHHGEGSARALPAWSGPAHSQPACVNPARLVLPPSSSVQRILAAGAGGGARGGVGRFKTQRYGGGRVRVVGGRSRDGGGEKHSKVGVERGAIETKEMTARAMSGKKTAMKEPLVRTDKNGAGGRDCVGKTGS